MANKYLKGVGVNWDAVAEFKAAHEAYLAGEIDDAALEDAKKRLLMNLLRWR